MSPHAPPLHGSPPPGGADLPWGGPAAGSLSPHAPPLNVLIQVNGAPHTTTACTLHEWVQAQGLAGDTLATAVNGQFVPRAQRAQTPLVEGDTIVTFQPIQGG